MSLALGRALEHYWQRDYPYTWVHMPADGWAALNNGDIDGGRLDGPVGDLVHGMEDTLAWRVRDYFRRGLDD